MEQRKFKGQSLFAFPSDYVVVDIETNGLSTDDCEIIEVSALKCRGYEVIESFSSLIKPTEPIGWFITNLTGITNEMVEDAPDAADVLGRFYDFVGKDIIIGHNVNFDVNFLYDKLWLHNGLVLDNDFVDTLRLARKALPHISNHKQTTIAEYYGIPTHGAHRALRDCEICNQCYLNLKKELNKNF
ncbi:MAG: 3'-5' exonuclease [Clostridiales bacterium]|nr:3'-5' exonuclease [Clostridiales bacterium]